MKQGSFFNTTNESSDDLQEYRDQVSKQEQALLIFFQQNPEPFSASELFRREVLAKGTPITSYRRAITNLTNAGHLHRCGKVPGMYGRPEYQWSIVSHHDWLLEQFERCQSLERLKTLIEAVQQDKANGLLAEVQLAAYRDAYGKTRKRLIPKQDDTC